MKAAAVLIAWAVLGVARAAVEPNQGIRCCNCDLMPTDEAPGSGPQVMPSPFKITLNQEYYRLNDPVIVEVSSEEGHSFRDMILIAWPTDNRQKVAVGTIKLLNGEGLQDSIICYTSELQTNGITVHDDKPITHLRFQWETNSYAGHLEFRATFVVSDDVYWVAEKSALLVDPRPEAPPLPVPKQRVIEPISTEDCGTSKGCYREPEGCWELNCEYIVTWRPTKAGIDIELGGLTDMSNNRYVAVGMSKDTYMGEDLVFACADSSGDDSTHVYLSVNKDHKNIPLNLEDGLDTRALKDLSEAELSDLRDGLMSSFSETGASHHNGRLRCRFTIYSELGLEDFYVADIPIHLLMARGYASKGRLHPHGLGVNELPIASPKQVILLKTDIDMSDRARYPLVKAHGCLMILAWIFFASVGLLMTKYYKTMWPNKRMFDQRYWFITHFNCMATVFLITVIGVILIFIEADGWSEAPELPQRAHPILGVIIFVCIIINPIIALLFYAVGDGKCRPVVNWFHWAFGTIANVLAIPQIFIGMDFGKANVPWWATWILVIWVIFHIIIELSLEIHQCCTYKKNKERRRKYEQQRRENPKLHIDEPEPAGRRFKRFMLFLHLTVTIIVTLIMIIIVAVC